MELVLLEYVKDHLPKDFDPYYIYSIHIDHHEVGRIVYRTGTINQRYFDGHIGYSIDESYRGHHYAYDACLLLMDIINQDEVIITCDPNNIASIKTIERLNGILLETKAIPSSLKHLFHQNEKIKNIYLVKKENL